MDPKHALINLTLDAQAVKNGLMKHPMKKILESDEEEVDNLLPLKDDEEEVKEDKELKILTPNKMSTRLPVLLAQTKTGNNSYKLKNRIRQTVYFLFQH